MLKSKIRTISGRPKPGISFKDITTLIQDSEGFELVSKQLFDRYQDKAIDFVAGIESRGFIFGGLLANKLGLGFIPIRKEGKLPADTEKISYNLEYGQATIEIHKDSIKQGQKILLIDDLIATGGSCLAACELIQRVGGNVYEVAAIIDLLYLGGSQKIKNQGYNVFSLVEYDE